MKKYIDINSNTEVDETDGEIVFMNIYDVIRAVTSWDDNEMPSTYNNAIYKESVQTANIAVRQDDSLPNVNPFLFDGDVYWELEHK